MKVFMYHRVVGDRKVAARNWTSLHVDDFRNHLRVLEQLGYTAITFRDYYLITANELTMPKKPVILTFDDGYMDNYEWAFPLLREFGMKAVVFVLGDRNVTSNSWDEDKDLEPSLLMNDTQVLEMHREGIEIGAHSMSHKDLTLLNSCELYKEVAGAKEVLETLIKDTVYSFSYPYGKSNEVTQREVVNAGYKFACSVFTGPAKFGDNPLDIRRITVSNDTKMVHFGMRVLTPFEYYDWFKGRMKETMEQGLTTLNIWEGNSHKDIWPRGIDGRVTKQT